MNGQFNKMCTQRVIKGPHLWTSPGLVLPEVEESVHDRVHDGVEASEDEQRVLDPLPQLVEQLGVADEPDVGSNPRSLMDQQVTARFVVKVFSPKWNQYHVKTF